MIDRIFSAALTFGLLVGGTLAIGSAMFGLDQQASAAQAAPARIRVVQLAPVVIVAKRLAPATPIMSAAPTPPAATTTTIAQSEATALIGHRVE